MGEDTRHATLKFERFVEKTKSGRIENHTFGTEFECGTGMSHTILTCAESIDLISLCMHDESRHCHQCRRGYF